MENEFDSTNPEIPTEVKAAFKLKRGSFWYHSCNRSNDLSAKLLSSKMVKQDKGSNKDKYKSELENCYRSKTLDTEFMDKTIRKVMKRQCNY